MANETQIKYTQDFLASLKAYNVNIDTNKSGTYWNILANAIGGTASQVNYYLEQVKDGNTLSLAPSFMLEAWVNELGLANRKPGYYAIGNIFMTNTTYPITVNRGSLFSLGTFQYQATASTTVEDGTTPVPIESLLVGASYNLRQDVVLDSADFPTAIATTSGIFGGSGRETDNQLQTRINVNIQARKTEGQLTDYNQKALELFNYASSETLFIDSVIPYKVRVVCANTISDYEVASQLPTLVDISLSTQQLTDLEQLFYDQRSSLNLVEVDTLDVQDIGNALILNITANETLSTTQLTSIREKTRQSLLEYTGEILYQHSLEPEITDVVTSYFFSNFSPIARTSITMDSLDISVVQN
jgi:hypothetical protein